MKKQNTKSQNAKNRTTESRVGRKKMTGRKAANAEQNPMQKMVGKAPQKLKAMGKKIEPTTVAKGAAAVSIAAGVVAAGALLADEQNRKKAGKMATKGMEFIQEMATTATEEARGRYQSVQMTIPLKNGNSKGRSSNETKSPAYGRKQSSGRSKSK